VGISNIDYRTVGGRQFPIPNSQLGLGFFLASTASIKMESLNLHRIRHLLSLGSSAGAPLAWASDMQNPIRRSWIEKRIYLLRGEKVILSSDLASLYEVEPKALLQSIKRNADRFPEDFMFQLSEDEFEILKSQIVTSSWGGLRKRPYAFTEQGISML
jgi:hypothetical protein